VVIRDAGPWTPAVHVLLRHLEDAGFAAAPRLVGSGFDPGGREVLTFIDGEFTQPGPWSLDGAASLGSLLRELHQATRSFRPPRAAVWFPWHGRDLGSPVKVIGHCDVAPWNIVARDGLPVALMERLPPLSRPIPARTCSRLPCGPRSAQPNFGAARATAARLALAWQLRSRPHD
jgi:Ser/Thr protein kinase RdoA (MazF antagonist)